ncbi:MAG: hypothetical protein HOP08_17205 [Cyclobacteriaceae bacterium]|nr:hypothetical protein [Cyclobacteriaceae bacterium]
MKSVLSILILCYAVSLPAQTLPFSSITTYPDTYTAGSVAARMIDGLGFRFYWATEGLNEKDLAYKPSSDARSCQETIEHIYEMSFMAMNAPLKKVNVNGQDVKLPFAEMRKKTLENLKAASDLLRKATDQDMKDFKVLYSDGRKLYEYPFWNLINGPIEDCVWHAGQIVAFRRASGNPIAEKDFFMGK